MLPVSDVKLRLQDNIPGACRRKNDGRTQRPTALVMCRNRSESPANRSKSRPCDPTLDKWHDMTSIQEEMEKKSGLLTFGTEAIKARMEDFEQDALLGHGTCSVVYKMRHRFRADIVMAVKNMRRSSDDQENKRILMDLHVVTKSSDCAYIVECFGIFLTTSDVWICMEVMSTSLDKLLHDLHRPFPEKVIGKITYSIITALDYLKRKHNVMHRDVKPSNMLLSYQGVVKLCDFGISGKLKDSIARSRQLGCIGYMAPERLSTPAYDVRADIWSLGISLLELATGSFPYTGTEIEFAIMSKIISDPAPSLPHHIPFTTAFRQFVEQCLQKDYHQRPKYSFLMDTEFFSRHASEPHDVLEWLRAIPLPHLQPQENHSPYHLLGLPLTSHYANCSSTPRTSSPVSAITLSPDRVGAYSPAPGTADSLDGLEAADSSDSLLNVTLVAAPASTNSEYYPTSKAHDSSFPSANGAVSNGHATSHQSTLPPSCPNGGDCEKSVDSLLAGANSVTTTLVKCSEEPSSQASSGYGSSGSSDSSPGAFSLETRPPNGSSCVTGKSGLPRQPPSSITVPAVCQRTRLSPATLVAPGIRKTAILTQPQATRLGTLTATSLVGPLVQAFEQASLLYPADRWRDNQIAGRDANSAVANPHSPRRPTAQLSPSQQTARSASVGTRLQRSHAQRWPPSRSPAIRRKTPQEGDPLPVSDLRSRCGLLNESSPCVRCPTDDRISTAAQHTYQNYQQHYTNNVSVAGTRPLFPLGMRTMTPPLISQSSRSDVMQYDSLPRSNGHMKSSEYGSSGKTSATLTVPSFRLMHRLNTHPPPRQAVLPTGSSSRTSVMRETSGECKTPPPPKSPHAVTTQLPPSGCTRGPDICNAGRELETTVTDCRGKHRLLANGSRIGGRLRSLIPTPKTCSHRSTSQPPGFHSGRIPFETEL